MATSPASASGNQATILDDDNWPIWSIRTEGLLIEAGLWSVVADGVNPLPTAPAANATQQEQTAYAAELARSRADSALDRKAKAFIQRHVSNLHIFTVKSADSAQDAWETLESQFTESSVARQSQLQQQLSLLRMEPGESVARFYARLQQLLTELEACNCETSESTVVLAILAALPPEYESTVERLRYDQTSADLKVERIKRVLLTKEADLLSKQNSSSEPIQGSQPMVQPKLNFNSDLYSPFCIDSGASQHILKDLQFFYNYTPFAPDKHRPVRLAAEGHRVWAVGSGSVFLSTKRGSWYLSHALYVPDSKQNFISVTAATDEGSSFLFRGDVCQISCNQFGSMLRVNAHKVRNSYILAAVPMPDGPDTDSEQEQGAKLYGVQQSALQPDPRIKLELLTNVAAPSANSATSNSPQVWHQRLCHTSYDALARMQSANMVSGVPVTAAQFRAAASDPAVCVGCVKGKQHKNVSFAGPPPNAAPVTAPLGLIHMDVCGPMHARARDGSLYVATFLDEHTKLSVCVPISSKAQVPDTVRTVIEELETQSGYRCKAIRTDNGTEYVNSRMREYCASKGIVHQHSAPYSPQQNGQPLTPWEAFYGVKPDLSGLRVFGCRVWLHVPDHQRSKLQAKSVEGLFIGYEPGSKAYRVLVNGRETCSKDIVFDELSVLLPTRQQDQPAQPVFLLPLPPSPSTPSEPLAPAAPAEGGNSLQQTSSSSSEDSGSSSSISRPGSSAQRPQSRPLEGVGAHQDSSSSDSPPRRQWEHNQLQHQQQQDQQHQLQHQQPDQQHQPQHRQQDQQHQLQHHQQHQQQSDRQQQLQHQQQQDRQHQDSDLFAMNVSDSPVNDTPTVAEALAGPMADLWIEAMNAELASLHANQTWCLEERPANARVLPTKWVLKVKRDAAGNIEKLKARLVAKGFYQQSGVDVGDVYAPVSKHTTLRTLLAKAAAENMEIHQLDFETAFLNGKLEPGEVIYVQQPEGFEEGSTNTVCRLQKALYGLRQAPRAWHARLCEELLSMGFKASEADPALFTLQLSTGMVYLLVYVDDCLLCTQQGDTAGLAHVKKQLSSAFKLKDLGEARWFLGMQLTRDRAEGTIKLDQHKFIQELVTANSKSAAHSKPLPMAPAVKLVREGDALDTTLHHYSALVGSLLYLTCCTRPDIAFAVGALARHMSAPTKQHWAAACSVLCYLKGSADQGLLFGGVSGLQGFSDADYAGDKDTARSTTGYIFTLNGGAISWSSRLQPTVAMSTAEAEYMAASSAAKEALWLRKLMRDLQLDASCVHLGCDNQAAIQLLHNPMATSRAKHIDVHHHFVRERISRGEVAFHYCHTSSMLADILTKPLAAVQFNMGKQGCGDHLRKKEELLRKDKELLRKKEELLRKNENFLLGKAVREPLQMDEVGYVLNMRPMFATVRVINDRKDPPIELQTEVLVDSGCAPELILPKQKFQQLQLGIMDIKHARGYGGAVTEMIVYRSVRVEVDLTDAVTGKVLETKSADLVPHSKSSDPDWVPLDQEQVPGLNEFAGFRGQGVLLPNDQRSLAILRRVVPELTPAQVFSNHSKFIISVDMPGWHEGLALKKWSAMKGKKRKGADEPKQPDPKVPKPKPKDKPDTVGWLEEEAANVSQQEWGTHKQLVVFFGNAGIGTRGGWGAKAVLQACRKVVERANSGKPTDRVPGKVVTVDEFRTSRVSSILNSPQPCEEELDSSKPTRPKGWKPKPGQVQLLHPQPGPPPPHLGPPPPHLNWVPGPTKHRHEY
ncbi:hypothetical protein QJQ45_003431 [Haematococcus lacustris]|nr:hypothetical protein QJQ45_003431 [Haematococcus lacustris]